MEKLTALTGFLRDSTVLKKAGLRINPENIHSHVTSGTPQYLGERGTDGGLSLFEHTYRATIVFEEAAGDIRMLIALILTWLEEHDGDRERLSDSHIEWRGDPYDDVTSDLEFEMWFWERCYFGVLPGNPVDPHVPYRGVCYGLGSEEVTIFEDDNPTLTATIDG